MEKSMEGILSKEELEYLQEVVYHPGWESLKKLENAIKQDWIDQTAEFDTSTKTDEEMIRFLRHRQGQIKGISVFLRYVEKKIKKKPTKDKK